MGNAEYDTPTSGDLADGDKDGREILEGLRSYLREIGSAVGALEKDSRDVGGPRLRRRVARLAAIMREGNDVLDGYVRAAEKWSSGFDSITRRDLAAAPAMSDLSPDTHVRMTVPKLVAFVVAVVVIVAGGVGLFWGVRTSITDIAKDLALHTGNGEIHLDPGYQFDHGRPVGKHDVDAANAQTDQRLKELATAIDQLRTAFVNRVPLRRLPQ